MKRETIILIIFGVLAWVLWHPQSRDVRPSIGWREQPTLIAVDQTSMSAEFSIDDAGIIYWRIFPQNSAAPRFYDFTNTNTEGTVAYGGGFLPAPGTYTNIVQGLKPNTSYVLYTSAHPLLIGSGGVVKKLEFSTTALPEKSADTVSNAP
ncbi:MAG: hypothetical protein ACRC9L_09905 [Brevinema sp.]